MRTRTAVLLISGATLLVAVPFAVVAWAFGGTAGLLAFVVPLLVLLAVAGGAAHLVRRAVAPDADRSAAPVR